MKNRKFLAILLSFCWVTLFCASGCQTQGNDSPKEDPSSLTTQYYSAMYPAFTVSEAVDFSTTIVYGEITNIKPAYQKIYPDISLTQTFTPIDIRPIRILKGENTATVLYNRLGGEYEGVVYRQTGDNITPAVGQKVMVFLDENSCDLGPNWALWEENGMVGFESEETHTRVEMAIDEYINMVQKEIN